MINYLTTSNYGYIKFTKNLIKNFILKNFLEENILNIVCFDEDTHIELKNEIINYKNIILIDDFINDKEFHNFNSPSFIKLTYRKTYNLIELLKKEEIIYFIDSDIHFFKDPSNYIKTNLKNYDIIFQKDSPETSPTYGNLYVCSGNYCVKQSESSINFFKNLYNTFNNELTEQQYLHRYLLNNCSNEDITTYKDVKIGYLDPKLFQNGYDAFEANWYLNEDKICVHANYLFGYDKKVEAFNKMNVWI
jgi:hypothetical protein